MKNAIALVLLVAGVCVAATSGSMLGTDQYARVVLEGKAAVAAGTLRKLASCDKAAEDAATQDGFDPVKTEATRQECRTQPLAPWGGELSAVDAAQGQAAGDLASHPPLEPGARLSAWFFTGGVGWLVGLVLIVVGAVLGRRAAVERANAPTTSASGVAAPGFDDAIVTLRETIAALRPVVAALEDGRDSPASRASLEVLENDVLAPLVEDRGRYQLRYGVAGFAEFFGPFSAGERNLARAWSALTDGYPHVAVEALDAADAAFEQAAAAFARQGA